MDFSSVKDIGGKLSSLNPFASKTEVTKTEDETNITEVESSEAVDHSASTRSNLSNETSKEPDPTAFISQAFNPLSKLGSKLTGYISSDEGQKPEEDGDPEKAEAATDKLKTLGSSLFTYGKQASASMLKSTTGALEQIKKTVEENSSVVADFSKQQEQFIEDKRQNEAVDGNAPWEGIGGGSEVEEQLKVKILELSSDERNVLRPIPAGQTFDFDMRSYSKTANFMLSLDSRLDSLRFKFVPKKITEEIFWRNYFYRVSLLKQSTDLMTSATAVASATYSSKDGVQNTDGTSRSSNSPAKSPDGLNNPDFQEELERAVQQELNEYELVDDSGEGSVNESDRNLEAEILAEIESK